jgi:hypothetical protein
MKHNESLSPHALSLSYHPGHPQTVAVFQALAKGFNVPITDDNLQYWSSMLTIGRALDSYVDLNKPDSLQYERDCLVAGLPIPGVSEAEAEQFSGIVHAISPTRREAVIDGLTLNEYAIAMRSARSYDNFFRLRVEEAEVFGRVMQLDNPEDHPEIARFNSWLPRFARAGYLVDSFGDLTSDYRDGIIALRPSISRRVRLGRVALAEAKEAVSDLPPRTIAFLAVASLSKIIRNGFKKK